MKKKSKKYRKKYFPSFAKKSVLVQTSALRKWRLQFVKVTLFLVGAIIFARLFQIQVLDREKYKAEAEKQYVGTAMVSADRGLIYDRNMLPLALNKPCYKVGVHKSSAQDLRSTSRKLGKVLKQNYRTILSKIRNGPRFVWIDTKVEPDVATAVARLKLPEVAVIGSSERVYPLENHLAQVIGFQNVDGKGISGIELAWDEYLRGENRLITLQRDALGRNLRTIRFDGEEIWRGKNVVLTIDNIIQTIAEEELRIAVEKHNAKGGSVVITNPNTGEIVAMASLPGFNANEAAKHSAASWRPRPITDILEPGSTFKIVTMVAALTSGRRKLDDLIYGENGTFKIFGEKIQDTKKHGWLTLRTAFTKSSNICIAKVAQRIGADELFLIGRKFGFGNQTGIELPGEVAGIYKAPKDWSKFSLAAISYGYEVAVTPLQMAMAYGAIASGGWLLKPLIVKEIRNRDNKVVELFEPQVIRRVMDQKIAEAMAGLLEEAVESGTGQEAKIQNLRIAGKTGTTQKLLNGGSGYSKSRYMASFAGFYPADQPKILIFLTIDEPGPSYYGGTVAAPAFRKILKRILMIYDHLEEKKSPQPLLATPTVLRDFLEVLVGRRSEAAISLLEERNLKPELNGHGPIVGRLEMKTPSDSLSEPEIHLTLSPYPQAEHQRRMPNLRGLSLRRAVSELALRGLKVRIIGTRRVERQQPSAGKLVKVGTICVLEGRPVSEIKTIRKNHGSQLARHSGD